MMTVDERLAHIRPKIERAKDHIDDLQRAIAHFLSSKPYRIEAKRDPQSRKLIYYVSSVSPTDVRIPLIAGDAIQNLMSALDHLAYQLVCVSTNDNPPNPGWIYFPIADDAAKYEDKKGGKLKGAKKDIVDAFDLIKPYKGGNDLLWSLYRLNNIEKHRLLLTVGSRSPAVNLGPVISKLWAGNQMPAMDMFLREAGGEFPVKVGLEVYIAAPEDEFDEKMQFSFDIAIGEPHILVARPLIETLRQMTQLVEDIVTSLEPHLR